MQQTREGEVSQGSPEERLINLQVVFVEEVRGITDIHVEQTTVVAEGNRSADSGDNDFALNVLLGQSTNALDDSGFQSVFEYDLAEFESMLMGEVSTVGAEKSFGRTAERVTFLSYAEQLEGTAQTSTPLKAGDASYG